MLKDTLTPYKGALTGQSELRAQTNAVQTVAVVGGNLAINSKTSRGGVSARTYCNGVYGFASMPGIGRQAAQTVIQRANDNARYLGDRLDRTSPVFPSLAQGSHMPDHTEKSAAQTDLIDFALQVDRAIAQRYSDLVSRRVIISCEEIEKLMVVSDGYDARQYFPKAYLVVSMSCRANDGSVVEYSDKVGGRGYFTDWFDTVEALHAQLEDIYSITRKKAEGVYADAGVRDVVMASDLAGILAHEAVGHTVESDMVLGGSVAAYNLNKPVATELVTLVDYANEALGAPVPQPVYVDDEGVQASDAVIIENGILRGYMHNRESAQHFGVQPAGNARAFSFSDEPLVRMRNTCIVPGQSKIEDMIAAIDDGYYLASPVNGQADSTGEFMFVVQEGYEIKGGKLGRAIRDTTISGVAFDMLKTVDMVSDELKWLGGSCGKKQMIAVGMGGPAIKARVNIGGR